MLSFNPLMMDDIPMTVATPMTTPRTVRKDRRVFLRSESSASSRISLIAQRHDRIQIGRFGGRIDSEEEAETRRYTQPERHCPPFNGSRKRSQVRNGYRNRRSEENPDDPADHGKRCGLHQELDQNIAAPRTGRLPDADLARAFGHRNQHD